MVFEEVKPLDAQGHSVHFGQPLTLQNPHRTDKGSTCT